MVLRRKLTPFLCAGALILVSFSAGCSGGTPAPASSPAGKPAAPYTGPNAMAYDEAIRLFNDLRLKAERILGQLRLYDGLDIGGSVIEQDGAAWRDVLNYPNVQAFKDVANDCFTSHFGINYYFHFFPNSGITPRFQDIDGRLYTNMIDDGGGEDSGAPYLMDTLRVVVLEEFRIEYEVDASGNHGTRLYELLRMDGEGWRFSVFARAVP